MLAGVALLNLCSPPLIFRECDGKEIVILGSQWGDEGKGKLVDYLTERADVVVRFQGGHNAGHTIVVGGEKIALRLMPCGILRDNVQCCIGNGVVLALPTLLDEIAMLADKGIDVADKLHISSACPLVLPSHIALDQAREAASGNKAIGTTGRGIGPTYEDKVARRGLRLSDCYHSEYFNERLSALLDYHNFLLTKYYAAEPVAQQAVADELLAQAEQVRPYVADVADLLATARLRDQVIVFEGAQGCLLDIDHGTYPYVTSSNTTAGAVVVGAGFGPCHIDGVMGITKAYTTRVGGGPFVTELDDAVGEHLASKGQEFGTVTGRPRRCGWFDAVVLRRAVQLNSFTSLCLTKLDVLDGLDQVRLCVGYETAAGERLLVPPTDPIKFAGCQPIYETMQGWQASTYGLQTYDSLPAAAKNYLRRIEELLACPIDLLSTGPDRVQTIVLNDPLSQ